MIVTIDGPAGAGKSSIARQVADRLEFEFLDTGAMYRAVTFVALERGLPLTDVDSLVDFVDSLELRWKDDRICVGDRDVSGQIRTPEVTSAIRFIADPPAIRDRLSAQQRRIASGRNIVTEGRDQGAEVFPDAECKIFLTASPNERARRRQTQLAKDGRTVTFEEILAAQNQRDLEDRMRPVGRLRAAPDAKVVQTDGMTPEEVLAAVLSIVEQTTAAQTSGRRE